MTPDQVFARKEIFEYLRTWRLKLLLIPIAFFALTGPLMAYFMPEILSAALGSENETLASLPDAVWQDVYLQWVKNLQQIIPFLIVIIAAGTIAGEVSSGTIIPVIAGGYPRVRIVIVKYLVHTTVAIVVMTVGTILTWATGLLIFPEIEVQPILQIVPIAALLIILIVAITILASSLMKDTLGAAGISIAVFFVIVGLSIWEPARSETPAGLLSLLGDAANGKTQGALWPTITTLITSALALMTAVRVFQRREV